ncbi:MAG TPA: toll/interleukin-1 receptor domain-containing protein [Chthoniobacteraceae bacterium]|nr:toll/interleukin-1 receptor domain-containing protein [Chthoniobacteraceae bacterium]
MELIVQYPTPAGYRCRGFRGISAPQGIFIAFDGLNHGDQPPAEVLGEAFCTEVNQWLGVSEATTMPCSGTGLFEIGCHAFSEVSCRKLLVALAGQNPAASGGAWPRPSGAGHWPSVVPDGTYDVLPVMPINASVTGLLPSHWQHLNVAFWRGSPAEALPGVLQRAGLSAVENRIFISYLRRETSPLADQLFAALTQKGYDVFVDRFSVPVGVDFQKQLQQDLSDKAMVVLLNSPAIATSPWVEEEIATVKRYRLGLFELCLPNATPRADVYADHRRHLQSGDFENSKNELLTPAGLGSVVSEIDRIHGRAIHRRRYELADNFAYALWKMGKFAQARGDGSFLVRSHGNEHVVALTSRPPELRDFCALHTRHSVGNGRQGWLISPAPNFLASRQAEVAWLGKISAITHIDESGLSTLAQTL